MPDVLTLVDVLRIQPFIFATNRLKDVVAGSELVALATEEELRRTGPQEVVCAAGGLAVLRFAGASARDTARAWAGRYSRTLIDDYAGLDVEVVHVDVDGGGWASAFLKAQQEMQKRKNARRPDAPLLGLGVTLECHETRGVTCGLDNDGRPIAANVVARRKLNDDDSRWLKLLEVREIKIGWQNRRLRLTRQTDELGRTSGETSLVGVVHIDANRVGQKILNWLHERIKGQVSDEAVREAQARLSREIRDVALGALGAVMNRIADRLEPSAQRKGRVELKSQALRRGFLLHQPDGAPNVVTLPIRPVVVGGDDITFICDGRIALDAARTALEHFRSMPVRSLDGPLSACAGVAIVKAHAPFSRAYDLAEKLCRSAKNHVATDAESGYAIDWHVGYTTPLEDLREMRGREYQGRELTCRPYVLGSPRDRFSFAWLDECVLGPYSSSARASDGFQSEFWQNRRNKIKELRELLREGPDAVAKALQSWKITANIDALPANLGNGFDDSRTCLLDAIELLDVHYPLR